MDLFRYKILIFILLLIICFFNCGANIKQYFMKNEKFLFHGISYTCPFNKNFMSKQFHDRLITIFLSDEMKKYLTEKYTINVDIEKFDKLKREKRLKFGKPFIENGLLGNFYTYWCTISSNTENIIEFDISISIDNKITFSILFFTLVNGKYEIKKKEINKFFIIKNENDLFNIISDKIFNNEYLLYWEMI